MEQGRRPARPPDPLIAIIEPSLKVGVACGVAGFIFGGASGIVRGAPPVLFGGITAIQTFALGATFSTLRSSFALALSVDSKPLRPREMTAVSALAGGISGASIGFLARGRRNVVPGAIMFTIFGATGQLAYNWWTRPKENITNENFWKRMGDKSWMPFKVLTNQEYAEMLKEKLLKVDVEISILDDRIAALKRQQASAELTPAQPKPSDD